MKAHRTLLIRLPKDECNIDYIEQLMALTNLAYREYEAWIPDLPKTIQHHLYRFKNYIGSLVFGTTPKRWFVRTWVPLETVRIYNDGFMKGDKSAPVVLDFRGSVIRLRQVCKNEPRYVVELPMPKWVVERIKEGGDVKYAMIGLRDDEPYLALVTERVVEFYEPGEYKLVVDVNSWRYGIAWGLIHNGQLVSFKHEKPNLNELLTLYYQAVKRGRKHGALMRIGLHRMTQGKRLRRQAEARMGKIYRVTRDKAYFLASKLVKKALKYRASLVIDDMTEESRRELLEEKLSPDVIKLLMSNLKRFIHQLETLAQWYGVPYEFRRLPSKVCPVCQHELTQEEGRTMVCPNCGFKAPRDLVPMYWAIKEACDCSVKVRYRA
jgi:putative transposase